MARVEDLRAAKERRQKKIAVIGGVLLIALLAFQGPRTLKMLRAGSSTPPPASAPATSPAPVAPPAPGVAAPAPVAAAAFVDTDPEPEPGLGQLVAFSLFASKDPFVQQVAESSTVDADDAGAGPAPARPAEPSGPTFRSTPTAAARPSSAVIAVNGNAESVQVGADFPSDDPTFRLVSLSKTQARIGIAGGSLASGDPTVALRKGKTLTLMNTADGSRYELRLVSVS